MRDLAPDILRQRLLPEGCYSVPVDRSTVEGYLTGIAGISLYVWSARQFFAAVLFTCKQFDVSRALDFTRDYFGARQLEHREIWACAVSARREERR